MVRQCRVDTGLRRHAVAAQGVHEALAGQMPGWVAVENGPDEVWVKEMIGEPT